MEEAGDDAIADGLTILPWWIFITIRGNVLAGTFSPLFGLSLTVAVGVMVFWEAQARAGR